MMVEKTIKSTLLMLIIVAAALLPAGTLLGESTAKSTDYEELTLFRDVMGIVQKNYVKDEALAKVFSCWVWMVNKLAAQARL